MQKPSIKIQGLSKQLENKYKEINHEHGDSLNTLIKVFPADTVDNVFYPGLSTQKGEGHYPSCDAKLPLKPYFHTLELIARGTHEALVKTSGANSGVEKTNVVSAMLCFVISIEPDKQAALTGYPSKQIFINVPINFDYKSVILSVDEVFKDEDDMEKSIGADLESGKRVAQRDITMPIDETERAKKMMMRLFATLNLDEATKTKMMSQIETAEIGAPVMLSYLTASDIAKSTEHRHSERVLNRALKDPKNVGKIIASIKQSMVAEGITKPGTYIIHSGALLAYSYPNSVCDGCSISFLALQNSYNKGFLAEFISAANANQTNDVIRLRTRGFNPTTRKQDPNEFSVTVIVGSSKIFSKDAYAKLIANRPEAKYSCHAMPYPFSKEGINLRYGRQAAGHNRFYEYTADSTLHTDDKVTVSYSGKLFMSGSKESKLSLKKQKQLETDVKKVVEDCDEAILQQSVTKRK